MAVFLYRNPRLLVLSLLVLGIAGLSAVWRLPRLEDPILSRRVGVVSTVYPGAQAQQVESIITIPLEQGLSGIPEIKQIRSNSSTHISNLVVTLHDAVTDVDPVWSRVREQMRITATELPQACPEPELEVFPLKAFAAILAVTAKAEEASKKNASALVPRRLARQLRARILSIAGTEQVDTFGDPGEEIVVAVNPLTLAAHGLSTAALAEQVRAGTAEQAAGSLHTATAELLLDINSAQLAVERISNLPVHWGRAHSTTLAEIADIQHRPPQPPRGRALVHDQQAVVLGVLVDNDIRVDRWAEQLEQVLQKFQREYASEVTVQTLFSQREHIQQRLQGLAKNLGLSTAAVIAVLLLCMGLRSMIVVALALPLSTLLVFAGMQIGHIPLHQMSVTGLIVALGLLIDNAIVMVENIRSRICAGDSPVAAIRAAIRQLAWPLFGSTVTTALAFLPIATLPGPAGEFVGTIAVSVILAITASFLLSMTLIPAMIGRVGIRSRNWLAYGLQSDSLEKLYRRSLELVFRFPLLGVLLGAVLPVTGFLAIPQLPRQFFPPSDRQQIQIEIERPARDTLAGVEQTVRRIQQIVQQDARLGAVHWFLGGSAPTFYYNVVPRRRGTAFYAQAFVDLRSGHRPTRAVQDLQAAIDVEILDSRVIVRQLEQGPPFDAPVEIRVVGTDLQTLQELGSQLRVVLSQTPHVIHTRSDLQDTIPKLVLDVNPVVAREANVSELEIAQFLYTTVQGAPAGHILEGGERLPIRVQVDFDPQTQIEQLAALPTRQPGGGPPGTPAPPPPPTLARLGQFDLQADVATIVRSNGQRVNEVKAYIHAGVLPAVVMDAFRQRLAASDFTLPDGYTLELGGETEQRSQAVDNLIANAVVLFTVMLFVLVGVFRSFRAALILACVGGFSIGLGPLALAWFGFPLGFMAMVGTMGLVGVAINDSIVVLAAIAESPATADSTKRPQQLAHIVCGCTRHIIATTLTTIVGFLPLVLGGGEFWPPLAIAFAGGVGGATVLALYFVPSLYLLLRN